MSNSVDILINGKETVGGAVDKSTNSLQRLNDTLHGTEGRLKGFNQVMELAFGFHVGRFFFEKIHESIVKVGEGFTEAEKAGMSFGDSLKNGIQGALGLSTALEHVNENLKSIRAGEKLFGEGKTKEAARTFGEEAQKQHVEANSDPFWQKFWYYTIGINTGNQFEAAKAEKDALQRLAVASTTPPPIFKNWRPREGEWAERLGWGGLRAFGETVGQGISNIQAGGGAVGGGLLGLLHNIRRNEIRGEDEFRDAHLTPQERARRQLDELRARGGAMTPEERKQAGYGILATLYSAAGINENSTIGSVAAQNARFLTRGTGPQQSPELNELQQMKKDIQDMAKTLLPDLTKAVKAFISGIGVAGA